jgi:hypothetical protein
MADLQPAAPSTARMIDYWLGGSDHHPIDIAAALRRYRAFGVPGGFGDDG